MGLSVPTLCVWCFLSSTLLNELTKDRIGGFSGVSYAEEVTQLGLPAIVSRQNFDFCLQRRKPRVATNGR